MVKGSIDSVETMGLVDGPGIRYVVFMQGCKLRCLFCHNPETWNMEDKNLTTPEELVAKIKKYKNYFGDEGGVTFSGGDPLCQPEFLLECLKLCKQENIHTCLDTSGVGIKEDLHQEILRYTDFIYSYLYKLLISFPNISCSISSIVDIANCISYGIFHTL